MAKFPRWTIDSIRSQRAILSARLDQISRFSESQMRLEIKRIMGFSPDTSVTHDALKRWLTGVAIDQAFPDSPPSPILPPEPSNV